MHPIIFLWAHPRSMSTAVERMMRERGDLHCLHEPFLHYFYITRSGKSLPHFDPAAGHPLSYEDTRQSILHLAEHSPVFVKDMSYYVIPELLQDRQFCECVQHCFLIRHPMSAILSYYRLDPQMGLDEIGIEAQCVHYQGLINLGLQTPVVLEAETIQDDTKTTMQRFWQALGLPYLEHAFSWQQDAAPQDWQYVEGWHQQVARSRGIKPVDKSQQDEIEEKFTQAAHQAPQLQRYLDHHWPSYQYLKTRSLFATLRD